MWVDADRLERVWSLLDNGLKYSQTEFDRAREWSIGVS